MTGSVQWDVSAPFTERVIVESGDIDEFAHTNNVVYLRWLERVAWNHSESIGLSLDDYRRLNAGCVARRHELDYLAATFAGDALMLATWIAECDGKFTMWRGYQIIRESDGRTVLRGKTHWVCVDLKTGRIKRMPPDFVSAYKPVSGAPARL